MVHRWLFQLLPLPLFIFTASTAVQFVATDPISGVAYAPITRAATAAAAATIAATAAAV